MTRGVANFNHRSFQSDLDPRGPTYVEATTRQSAELASEQLAMRCNRAIQRFADHWRISDDEARVLLLNTGVRI